MPEPVERLQQALADRYRIERELGAGGMATVYLAEDLKHQRRVALKVLRPELAAVLGGERFHREIQIAAQLQHPNILPLLDSGEAAGFLYYAMPYVEGQSLRERLAREGALPISDTVRIVRDVVDALTEAHAHGVVHRDIKPENIMLRGHHALVTDFGVAKAVSEATGRQTLTTAGVALGTPAYMAPEQASADPHLDHRVDIYAVGAVAYELLTGRPVFMGTTPQMVLSAHMAEAPVPITKLRETVPRALEALVMRCLEKKPADRWQSAEELLPQLEALATPSGGITPTQTQPVRAVATRKRVVVGAVGAVVVLAVIGFAVAQLLRSKPLSITISDLTQVTSAPGVEFEPALSPDGKEVAYVAGPMGGTHLMVRGTTSAGGGELRFADTAFAFSLGPDWSPDGTLIRFVGCRPSGCTWHETGRLGGTVRPVNVRKRLVNTSIAWSPDGARIAYFVRESLFVEAVGDTAPPRRVAVHPGQVWGPHSLAWSPDGKLIAYVNGNFTWVLSGNVSASSIWIVSTAGGTPRPVTSGEHLNVSPAWLDPAHLLFVSDQDGARAVYVVRVGPGGARSAPRIVPGVPDAHSISYSIASGELAWSKFRLRQNIWAYPLGRAVPISIRDGVRLTTGNEVSETADVSPDGRWLVYESNLRGHMELYKMPRSGGEAERLTDAPTDAFGPRWSPDGTEIVFYAAASGGDVTASSVVVMAATGGRPVALTDARSENAFPVWSRDGLHIAFMSTRTGRGQVWVLSRDSVRGAWRPEVQLTDSGGFPHDWAPDGSGVLCSRGLDTLFLVSRQKRVLWHLDRGLFGFVSWSYSRFARDGKTIYILARHRNGREGLWAIPTSGREAARLVIAADEPSLLPVEAPFNRTNDRVYLAVSEYESDIWVAKLRW